MTSKARLRLLLSLALVLIGVAAIVVGAIQLGWGAELLVIGALIAAIGALVIDIPDEKLEKQLERQRQEQARGKPPTV